MTNIKMICWAKVFVMTVATLTMSACSENDDKVMHQSLEEHTDNMMEKAKEVVGESSSQLSDSVAKTIDESKEMIQKKSEEITESAKAAVAEVSDDVAEKAAQATAMLSKKAADGAALFKSKGCAGCHGANAMGSVGPRLAGQQEEYIATQFKLIRDGKRTSGQSSMMAGAVKSVSDAESAAIAGYLAAL